MKQKNTATGMMMTGSLRQSGITVYQAYTTEEALREAAKSYGGLTEKPF